MRYLSLFLSVILLSLLPQGVLAEQSETFGDYVVHYNALNTSVLSPSVAKTHGIQRSKNRAMLNITVLRKVLGTTGEPVQADVKVSAKTLSGQQRGIKAKEVREGQAIYYIGDFAINDNEVLDFSVDVMPKGSKQHHTVSFRQRFFAQ